MFTLILPLIIIILLASHINTEVNYYFEFFDWLSHSFIIIMIFLNGYWLGKGSDKDEKIKKDL